MSSSLRLLVISKFRHVICSDSPFDSEKRLFDFKINFLFEFLSNASTLLVISRTRHVLDVDMPLIQSKEC